MTEQEAEQLLQEDLADAQAAVERYIAVPLTDNQFAALVSFTFNLGAGSLKTSTLRRRLNTNDYDAVPSELARWVKAGGKTLEGLVRRRAAEGEPTPPQFPPKFYPCRNGWNPSKETYPAELGRDT